MKQLVALLLLIPPLTACDAIKDRMGIPIPEKVEAEGKAIGSACRHAGRGLEDCFRLNPKADKAAVHNGWKEMNEYMLKNNMQSIPPEFPSTPPGKPAKHEGEADESHGKEADAKTGDKTGTAHAEKDAHAEGKGAETAKPEKPDVKPEAKPTTKSEAKPAENAKKKPAH